MSVGPDVAVVVVSCWKRAGRWAAVRQALVEPARRAGCRVFVAVGEDTGASVSVPDGLPLLRLEVSDAYEGLPQKVLAAYRHVATHTKCRWVYKCDDDVFVNLPRLFEQLAERLGSDAWGMRIGPWVDRRWHFGKCADPELNATELPALCDHEYLNGGAGYVLGRAALEAAAGVDWETDYPDEWYEDKCVGRALLERGMELEMAVFDVPPEREAFEEAASVLGHDMNVYLHFDAVEKAGAVDLVAANPMVLAVGDCEPAQLLELHRAFSAGAS